jgi:hypothetical protein
MGRRFVWHLVDASAEPVAVSGEAIEYVEQHPRPGDLALFELRPAGVAAIGELVSSNAACLVIRDLTTGEERKLEMGCVQRLSRVVGTRNKAGDFVRLARGWPV